MAKPDVEAEDFLRALMAVSPEDAAEVREIADVKAKPDADRSSPDLEQQPTLSIVGYFPFMAEAEYEGEFEIRMPSDQFGGVWSNFAVVSHSPYEFTIDFVRLDYARGQGQVTARVNLSPLFVTQLLDALQDNWKKYADKALPKEAQGDANHD